MKRRINPETKRRIFHICSGLAAVGLIYFGILTPLILIIILVIGGILSVLSLKYKLPVFYWLLKHLDRPQDMKTFPGKGSFYYVLGILLSLVLFDKDIAMASIMIMALGDSVAPLVGHYYGQIKHPLSDKKFLEGTIAGGIAAFLGAWAILSITGTIISNAAIQAVFASIAAMIVEGINIKFSGISVNDNISMPVVAGLIILLLRLIL